MGCVLGMLGGEGCWMLVCGGVGIFGVVLGLLFGIERILVGFV